MSTILTEWTSFDNAKLVIEAIENEPGKPKSLYLTGTCIQGNIRNLNDRVYPLAEIRRAVETVQETLAKGESVLGECDHPEQLTINLDRVSHMITKMWMDGDRGMGKLKILPTPKGEIIRTMIEAGVKLGVSSRGSGNVTSSGQVSEFEIVTVDIVAKPSAQGAYPQPVYEALNGRHGAILEDLATAVSHDPRAQKHLQKMLLSWVEKL